MPLLSHGFNSKRIPEACNTVYSVGIRKSQVENNLTQLKQPEEAAVGSRYSIWNFPQLSAKVTRNVGFQRITARVAANWIKTGSQHHTGTLKGGETARCVRTKTGCGSTSI